MSSHEACLPQSLGRTPTSALTDNCLSSAKSLKGGHLAAWVPTADWSPDARVSFSVRSSIAIRALLIQQKTCTLLPSEPISLTCSGTAVQGHLVWPGEAGCTWPPGTGLQSFLLLAAHSAERHGQWLGSYGLYVLQQRRVVELAISGEKKLRETN